MTADSIEDLIVDAPERQEIKMWLAVRMDLPISVPKLVGQSGHAFGRLYMSASAQVPETMRAYLDIGETKVVVKATNEHALLRVADEAAKAGIPFQLIRDAGKTEIPAGTATVCAFGPARREDLPKFLAKLQFWEEKPRVTPAVETGGGDGGEAVEAGA